MSPDTDLNDEINRRKKGKVPYDAPILDFTTKMNDALLDLESELMDDTLEEIYPNIFIIGQSRTGTTLLSQILFNNLDIACTNNLMAKFWKAPLVGAYLSKISLGDKKSATYDSVYGRTNDIYSPNGFGWFWRKLLNIEYARPDLSEKKEEGVVNWPFVKSVIININHILNKSVLYKPAESLAVHLPKFDSCFSKAIYIYIERDLLDIAVSLAKARIDYYNSIEEMWWSALAPIPEEYKKLKGQPYEIQIAGQIYWIEKMFEKSTKEIPQEKLIRIKYNDLCANPKLLLDEVCSRSLTNYNISINQLNTPPVFKTSHPDIDKSIKDRLYAGLQNFQQEFKQAK